MRDYSLVIKTETESLGNNIVFQRFAALTAHEVVDYRVDGAVGVTQPV